MGSTSNKTKLNVASHCWYIWTRLFQKHEVFIKWQGWRTWNGLVYLWSLSHYPNPKHRPKPNENLNPKENPNKKLKPKPNPKLKPKHWIWSDTETENLQPEPETYWKCTLKVLPSIFKGVSSSRPKVGIAEPKQMVRAELTDTHTAGKMAGCL